MIIWVVKLFFVQFCVFLPPLLNVLCFCLLHTISVLYQAHLCMKCSLGISNFLEEISSLSHSVVFLYFFALIAEERVAKGKEERERYTQLNAEFQRIAMRDKKAFLSEQWKQIKENNGMRKTRDLKNIGDTKGTFHAKMGTRKDRNSKDLTEAEEIKKRWQEYTELYKKGFNDLDYDDGVITHLQPDILECEVKWTLGSITMNKASGDDGIPAELFRRLQDDAVKVLHSICQQI